MGVTSREKHPLQQLYSKRGVGVFLSVGLFSGVYSNKRLLAAEGMHNDL